MKLVDILARELNEWPKAFGDVLGQRCDGTLHGYNDAGFATWIGETPQLTRCDNYMHNIVTRAQWQEARDALNKPAVEEWNGEGLPPVGTKCEWLANMRDREWIPTTICGHSTDGVYAAFYHNGAMGWGDDCRFRPIRTPEQIAAEERNSAQKDIKQIILSSFKIDAITASGIAGVLADSDYRKKVTK